MRAHKDMSREPLRVSQRFRNTTTGLKHSKRLCKEYPDTRWKNFYSLLREYTVLNARILTDYFPLLTQRQRAEEIKLRYELFDLLRQKGVFT